MKDKVYTNIGKFVIAIFGCVFAALPMDAVLEFAPIKLEGPWWAKALLVASIVFLFYSATAIHGKLWPSEKKEKNDKPFPETTSEVI